MSARFGCMNGWDSRGTVDTARDSPNVRLWKRLQRFPIRRPGDSPLRDDRRDISIRSDIERGIFYLRAIRGDGDSKHVRNFAGSALFDRDLITGSKCEIERGDRSRN